MMRWGAVLLITVAAAPALAAPGSVSAARSQLVQVPPTRVAAQPAPAHPASATQPAPGPPRLAERTPPVVGAGVKSVTPTDPILAHLSPVYETCMHRAGSTNDMLDCGARESERWDGRLSRAFQARMSSLNERQRSALKFAQKAWLTFRQADCSAYEDEDWGSISRIDASQCVLRRTVERTLELEAFPADHGPG